VCGRELHGCVIAEGRKTRYHLLDPLGEARIVSLLPLKKKGAVVRRLLRCSTVGKLSHNAVESRWEPHRDVITVFLCKGFDLNKMLLMVQKGPVRKRGAIVVTMSFRGFLRVVGVHVQCPSATAQRKEKENS